MNMPGFTANSSLYETARSYRVSAAGQLVAGSVVPQFSCGACECDQNECCYYSVGQGGDCACLPRNSKGRCPQIGRLKDLDFPILR